MENLNTNFKGINVSKNIKPLHRMYLAELKNLEQYASGIDVFISSAVKNFPYRRGTFPISSIKISARPQKLNFWEKLFGKKTVSGYVPVGNMSNYVEGNKSFREVFMDVVSKAKDYINNK